MSQNNHKILSSSAAHDTQPPELSLTLGQLLEAMEEHTTTEKRIIQAFLQNAIKTNPQRTTYHIDLINEYANHSCTKSMKTEIHIQNVHTLNNNNY